MYKKSYSRKKRRGAIVTGLTIASLSILPTTVLTAGGFQLPEINPATIGQATTNGAKGQQPAPTKGSTIAKTTLGLDTLFQEYQDYETSRAVRALAEPFRPKQTLARVTTDNRVVIDAVTTTDPQELKGQLESLGAVVTGVAGKMVSAQLPLDQIPALSRLPNLLFARPALAFTRTGDVTSQGDQAMRADRTRSTCFVNGARSTVGVLSDSYNCLGGAAADVLSGDLPDDVNVIQEISNCTDASDEGRAMAQIIYDVAPGASLAFHTAFNGEADFAQGIIDLRNAGANIIVDDVGYFAEPFFQDGVIAQAVNTVVATGATYFSSAGNAARQSYEAPFRSSNFYPAGTFAGGFFGGTAHDFNPDPGVVDEFQKITCPAGRELIISLQWDNPFPSLGGPPPTADIDVYLLDDPPTTVIASSTNIQPGADPVEIFGEVPCPGLTRNLMIVLYDGVAPSRIKYVDYGFGTTFNEYHTQSPTSVGHPNAAGAIAVGASAYFLTPAFGTNPPVLNYYSSAGGVPILFQANGTPIVNPIPRAKPEITGPDGGNNTFFGGDFEPDSFPNFFGTSASAPHAAGVAALLRHINNTLTPAAIKASLQATATDIRQRETGGFGGPRVNIGAGFDNDSGAGLINAPHCTTCDVDGDGDIDKNDLSLISRARGQIPALGDPRDANSDGKLDPADVKVCIRLCARPNCATQ